MAETLHNEVAFYHVDTDKSPDLAEKFGIQAIPVLMRFKDGKQVAQIMGFQPEVAVRNFAVSV